MHIIKMSVCICLYIIRYCLFTIQVFEDKMHHHKKIKCILFIIKKLFFNKPMHIFLLINF